MTNVYEFPKDKIFREVSPNIEEVEKAKIKGKQNYADGIVAEVAMGLLEELENYGINLEDEDGKMSKDFLFLVDVLKSTIYRNMQLTHQLQEFVDENVAVYENEEAYKEVLAKLSDVEETKE